MLTLNKYLFLLLNASADAPPSLVLAAEVLASGVVIAVALLLVGLWIWGSSGRRAGLSSTGIAAALALIANQFVGLLWYEPRPFMIGLGHTLIAHSPENSFPSDHTTFMLTVGFGLLATRAAPAWGRLVCLLGVLVAWARIYLGVHFPIDMLASGLIACVFGGLAALLVPLSKRWITPVANRLYESTLDLLRLPRSLFPRNPSE